MSLDVICGSRGIWPDFLNSLNHEHGLLSLHAVGRDNVHFTAPEGQRRLHAQIEVHFDAHLLRFGAATHVCLSFRVVTLQVQHLDHSLHVHHLVGARIGMVH